tara:strand:+ start:209 stop:655 length:447 start_codon:yes stop_codon:yes gene_type:complete
VTLRYKGKILSKDEIDLIVKLSAQRQTTQSSYDKVKGATMLRGLSALPELQQGWARIKKHIDSPVKLLTSYALEYTEGNHSIPHWDVAAFTAITMLPCSFEGGDLLVDEEYVDLEEGETVIFDTDTYHEVQPIESGKRLVLVTWYDNK